MDGWLLSPQLNKVIICMHCATMGRESRYGLLEQTNKWALTYIYVWLQIIDRMIVLCAPNTHLVSFPNDLRAAKIPDTQCSYQK